MSGFSTNSTCPICESKDMSFYSNYKPFDMADSECLNCGFVAHTIPDLMSLKDLNKRRKEEANDRGTKFKPISKKQYDKYKKIYKEVI